MLSNLVNNPKKRTLDDAERDIEYSTRRIGEIGQDIERLVPTGGDAFHMGVGFRQLGQRRARNDFADFQQVDGHQLAAAQGKEQKRE